jgi:hypothetical protein
MPYHLKEGEHYKKIDRDKFKYELLREMYYISPLLDGLVCYHDKFKIISGCVTGKEGYAWDGPSGPTYDRPENMRAALFHDILYQAINEGKIPKTWRNRRKADKIFLRILKEDGMNWFSRRAYFYSVRGFGALFAY